MAALLAPLNDPETVITVAAERGVMRAVEGNCQVPVAAFAERRGEDIRLRALLAEPDGSRLRRDELVALWPESADAADRLGSELGTRLKGA